MIIYKILNKINGKCYIGRTTYGLDHRVYGHIAEANRNSTQLIHKMIRKYGIQSFDISVIDTADSDELLNEKEIYWIRYLNTKVPNGYNMSYGGEAGNTAPRSEESNQKRREKLEGKCRPEEVRKKISESHKGEGNPFFGRKHSEETRRKMSKSRMGNKNGLGNLGKKYKSKKQEWMRG